MLVLWKWELDWFPCFVEGSYWPRGIVWNRMDESLTQVLDMKLRGSPRLNETFFR